MAEDFRRSWWIESQESRRAPDNQLYELSKLGTARRRGTYAPARKHLRPTASTPESLPEHSNSILFLSAMQYFALLIVFVVMWQRVAVASVANGPNLEE